MGKEVLALCESGYRGAECIGGVDAFAKGGETFLVYKDFSDVPEAQIDCIVDFSHHTLTPALLDFAIERGIPTVLCTTAHTPEEKAKIALAAENGIPAVELGPRILRCETASGFVLSSLTYAFEL